MAIFLAGSCERVAPDACGPNVFLAGDPLLMLVETEQKAREKLCDDDAYLSERASPPKSSSVARYAFLLD